MRKVFSDVVERGRVLKDLSVGSMTFPATKKGEHNGLFFISKKGNSFRIMISDGGGWDHVSVSLNKNRCPNWEEMCWIKDLFFDDEEAVIQIHPKESDYVNFATTTLHLWRYQKYFPLPPSFMVGPRNRKELEVLLRGR